jgi:DNA-binding NarL/FixJ family response regulator
MMMKIHLTPKERQVCRMLLRGLTNRKIAVELGRSESTLRQHIDNIFDKMGMSTRLELMIKILNDKDLLNEIYEVK